MKKYFWWIVAAVAVLVVWLFLKGRGTAASGGANINTGTANLANTPAPWWQGLADQGVTYLSSNAPNWIKAIPGLFGGSSSATGNASSTTSGSGAGDPEGDLSNTFLFGGWGDVPDSFGA